MGRSAAIAAALMLIGAAPALGQNPLPNPPGVNDYACKPPARHPYPIVVVHGTASDQQVTNQRIVPVLKRLGYCIFSLDYGGRALGDIPTSAKQLDGFVDKVLAATKADRVSIVGHSQGGMMPRYYLRFLGGTGKVDDLVGFVPSNYGTTTPLAPLVGAAGVCPACLQQVQGSSFLAKLNAGNPTPAPISYTVITTRYDEIVTPYTNALLPAAGGRVRNFTLQDACPANAAEHVGIIFDGVGLQYMLSALGRRGPADPNLRVDCSGAAADTFPDSDSGRVPEQGAASKRACTSTRVRRLRRKGVGCARARRVVAAYLRRKGNPRRFGRWKCRRSKGRVRCVQRGAGRKRVSFALSFRRL